MVKKVIANPDSSKASGPECLLVVVLKNFEAELAEVFNDNLKKSCFADCWKVSLVFPVFKNVGAGLQLKTSALLLVSSFCG